MQFSSHSPEDEIEGSDFGCNSSMDISGEVFRPIMFVRTKIVK